MIPRLASPSVCVIDDEEAEYRPLLDALLSLGIAGVHVRGDSSAPLPERPFKGLRIVFMDLYLSNAAGKTAAAHAANVFKHVVSGDTAPVLVVIWSKHAEDRGGDVGLPEDDQPTALELFVEAVFEAEPLYRGRLIITNMPKPRLPDRPEVDWVGDLCAEIKDKLGGFPACDLLWSWESIVREAGLSISEGITDLALHSNRAQVGEDNNELSLDDGLKLVFRHLVKEQGGPSVTRSAAPRHLATVLAQSLADELEHAPGVRSLERHGEWLSDIDGLPDECAFAPQLNALLLTADKTVGSSFLPGTVFRVDKIPTFERKFGVTSDEFFESFFREGRRGQSLTIDEWKREATPIAVEISPVCDFHQNRRRQALLIGGLLVPATGKANAKTGESFQTLPVFRLRWPVEGNAYQDVYLVFCSRYKLTVPHKSKPRWIVPWFRLRELPAASLRNWHASHSARVGYVSLR